MVPKRGECFVNRIVKMRAIGADPHRMVNADLRSLFRA
jgi:hypothetical protein